jgi:phage tail protein X
MADKYITIQGDTWDGIAYSQCGSEKYMKNLIEANWKYLDTLVFSSGVELTIPDISSDDTSTLPDWRSGNTANDLLEPADEGGTGNG